ncbi:MAG TPA: GGDEF domain-containing protein [Acidobacteriaceae bacterium]|nr:GGDEF domain-containing protein [Acidobacteriaceae bacterium]
METHIILVVASILLSGGCIGLALVRLTNPFFKGTGWLGACFASGALGASIFMLRLDNMGSIAVLVAYILILLAFVLLDVCFVELSALELHVPKVGTALLLLQVLVYLVFRHFHSLAQITVMVFSMSVALQVCENAFLLMRTNPNRMDSPVWFNVTLLLTLAAFNIFRSLIVLLHGFNVNPQSPNPLEATTAIVFLGAAIGLGFGVFWMEGHQIRLELEKLANIDSLTGIHNRRSFTALCEQELLRTSRTGDVFSLIMFDVDHFKQVNDRYGHRTGDTVLCAVVEKLRNSVRNIDIVGRWGGEEFVALLPRADTEAAMIVADRLRYHIDSIAVPSPRLRDNGVRHKITITVSIGVATYLGHDPTITIQDLLHQCDSAMYQAKAEGRDRIVALDTQLMLVR